MKVVYLFKQASGYLLGLAYCLLTAGSVILIQKTDQDITPLMSSFIIFLITACWFNLYSCRSLKKVYAVCVGHLGNTVLINLWTAMTWLGTFYALEYVSPILFITLFMGLIPTATYFLGWMRGVEKYSLKPLVFGGLIIVLVLLLIGVSDQLSENLGIGCFWTLMGVIGAAFYLLDAKQFQEKGQLSSIEMLSIRFWGLILITAIGAVYTHDSWHWASLPYENLGLLALMTSILPMYCMQTSLKQIGPVKISFLMPWTPIFTYVLLLALGVRLNSWVLVLLCLLVCVLVLNSWFKLKK